MQDTLLLRNPLRQHQSWTNHSILKIVIQFFYCRSLRRACICAILVADGVHPVAGQGKTTDSDGIAGNMAKMPPGAAAGMSGRIAAVSAWTLDKACSSGSSVACSKAAVEGASSIASAGLSATTVPGILAGRSLLCHALSPMSAGGGGGFAISSWAAPIWITALW